MNLRVIWTIAIATVVFASALPSAQAKPAPDVQTLANFPALQRLAKSEGKTLRKFLHDVSSEYQSAGYGAFAQALPKADALIALFGEPDASEDTGALKKARATLRRLQNALAKNPRVALPRNAGETIPDYRGIAAAFNQNASRALKNLSAGKNVANFLRKKAAPAEITNIGNSEFTFTGTAASATSSGSVTTSGSVTVIAGATTSSASYTLKWGWSSFSGGSLATIVGYRWIAFPPGEETPADWTDLKSSITITSKTTAGPLTLPAGSRLVQASLDYAIPANTTELPAGVTLNFGNFAETLRKAATPSPTPAE